MAKRRENQNVKVFESKKKLNWDYDGDADVLYLSFGKPKEAVGIDVGDGVIVRYDEENKEVVGLTIIGINNKLSDFLSESKN